MSRLSVRHIVRVACFLVSLAIAHAGTVAVAAGLRTVDINDQSRLGRLAATP
jgi:hypothetical protein